MPALPPVPSVIHLQFKHSVGSAPDVFVGQYWRYTGQAPSSSDLQTFAGRASNAWDATIALSCSSAVHLTETIATDLTSQTAGQGIFVSNLPGTAGAQFVPANVAVLVNDKIARRYRGGKPRSYWPMGLTTDLGSPEAWLSASVTNFQARVDQLAINLLGAIGSAGTITQQVNVSYYYTTPPITNPDGSVTPGKPAVRPNPLVDPIIGRVVNPIPGSQRRRLRASGT